MHYNTRSIARSAAIWAAALAALAGAWTALPASAGQPGGARGARTAGITSLDWPGYLYSTLHSSSSSGPTAITVANAATLAPAWKFAQQPPTGIYQPGGGFSASPTVAGGMVFVGSQTGDFYALNEATGSVAWSRTLDYEQKGHNGNCEFVRGIVATATVAPDPLTGTLTVYAAGARYLYALDALTGAVKWKTLVGPANSAAVVGAYFNYASPTISNGIVYMGISSSCDAPFVRGGVESFSQATGTPLHTFWTDPPGRVGASVWSTAAAQNGSVWASTGDPRYTGAHLYHAYSILRLGASTLVLRDSFQLNLPQAADLDFGSSPTMFWGDVKGRRTTLVGACSKDGRYYTLRRYAMRRGPVWSEVLGAPDHVGHGTCLASGVWDATNNQLYLAGNGTTIAGKPAYGTIREVNPGTGKIRWLTRLPCAVLGTPSIDAATGVLAAVTWGPCRSGASQAVYLLNAATGAILKRIPQLYAGFAQPVFAGNYLLVADETGHVIAYAAGPAIAAPCTGWCQPRPARPGQPPVIPQP
jgi:outer membrane protein assembly factor BamB